MSTTRVYAKQYSVAVTIHETLIGHQKTVVHNNTLKRCRHGMGRGGPGRHGGRIGEDVLGEVPRDEHRDPQRVELVEPRASSLEKNILRMRNGRKIILFVPFRVVSRPVLARKRAPRPPRMDGIGFLT